jgi:hypothetical protein
MVKRRDAEGNIRTLFRNHTEHFGMNKLSIETTLSPTSRALIEADSSADCTRHLRTSAYCLCTVPPVHRATCAPCHLCTVPPVHRATFALCHLCTVPPVDHASSRWRRSLYDQALSNGTALALCAGARMFTECSLNVHSMFTQCLLNVHSMFTQCSLNVCQLKMETQLDQALPNGTALALCAGAYMFTECLLNVHSMFTQCSLNIYSMSTECSLNVHSMFTQCLPAQDGDAA